MYDLFLYLIEILKNVNKFGKFIVYYIVYYCVIWNKKDMYFIKYIIF